MVNGAYLAANPELAEEFAPVTQRAYRACVADFAPCLNALPRPVTGQTRRTRSASGGASSI